MFDANGTEGLELFTWIVAGLLALVAALVLTHVLTVTHSEGGEGVEEAEEVHEEHHKETTV